MVRRYRQLPAQSLPVVASRHKVVRRLHGRSLQPFDWHQPEQLLVAERQPGVARHVHVRPWQQRLLSEPVLPMPERFKERPQEPLYELFVVQQAREVVEQLRGQLEPDRPPRLEHHACELEVRAPDRLNLVHQRVQWHHQPPTLPLHRREDRLEHWVQRREELRTAQGRTPEP